MSEAPEWFTSLSLLGKAAASQANREVGDEFPVTLLSVPTGQFVVWALLNGAFDAASKVLSPKDFPSICVAWNEAFNGFIDRALLHGSADRKVIGYF